MKDLLNKYIERIKIDYPEDDKLMIDLQDFLKEATSNTINFTDSSLQLKEKKATDFEDWFRIHVKEQADYTYWYKGKIHSLNELITIYADER